MENSIEISDKTKAKAFSLCSTFGTLGAHRFYVGRTNSGIAMVILTCTIVGILVSAPWALVDWFRIISGKFTDAQGRKLRV